MSEVTDPTPMQRGLQQEVSATCDLMMAEGRIVFGLVIVRDGDQYSISREARGDLTPTHLRQLSELLTREAVTLLRKARGESA